MRKWHFLMGIALVACAAQTNPGYDKLRNLPDADRAITFADVVNASAYVKKDPKLHCTPMDTRFLGMKKDLRAGYILSCWEGEDWLMIILPDSKMTVEAHDCIVGYLFGDNGCEDDWRAIK